MATDKIRRFPKDPVLVKLLESAKLTTGQIIHDAYGFDKTYAELLGDIVKTRDSLRANLPPSTLNNHGLLREEYPYVCALTCGGYEFIVALFTIRAMGGACLPFASGLLAEEAYHFISEAKVTSILMGGSHIDHAGKIRDYVKKQGESDLTTLLVSSDASPLNDVDIGIDEDLSLAPGGPGVVMFTSGTTGIPKAAVLPRQCLVLQRAMNQGGGALSYQPPHWRGGFASLINLLIAGMPVYILKQQAPAEDFWEVLRDHRITNLIFNPTLLRKIMNVYTKKLNNLQAKKRKHYINGFKNLGKIKCSGAILAPTVLGFWADLTGLPVQNGYGSTECGGGVMQTDISKPTNNPRSVGILVTDPPVDVKLANGDHGEVLVKSPWMLTKYIGNEKATQEAFVEEGYLKTGDLGHIVDVIGRIPRILVEDALTNLPYIAEGFTFGIPDHKNRAVCAALIRVKKNTVPREEMSLLRLHTDLADALPVYMRPYLLRVLNDEEEVPYTASQKPMKRDILKEFFGVTEFWNMEDPTPGVEVWGSRLALILPAQGTTLKPWDWGTSQISG
ncbi:Acyl-CoA ligase oryP-like protein [Cladobotryum mycophilum]|uniref:Acyl-CoA ligase oryP-like protein n=1 Tax=Cladobotryum mycophilum TaxID=491253 RepID=A0ABR0SID5_9HYPO